MNDKPQPKPNRESFPVRRLQLRSAISLPNGGVSDVILGGESQLNKPRFVVEYVPSMRHHRVCYFAPNAETPSDMLMICESSVAYWVPVQQ